MPNRWIEHVKQFAKDKNLSYACAMSDPDLKKGYVPTGDKKRKPEKLEMAVPSTEPKAKAIAIKPRPAGAEPSLFVGMNEKEIALTKAYRGYYEAQDNDFELYVKVDKNGDIKGENKKALKALTDNLADEFKLPKTWLKQADKVAEKYGLGFGNNPNKQSKDYKNIMFYRAIW